MEEKYSTNTRWCNVYLNGKKARIAYDVTICKYKNILQAQQTPKKFRIPAKVE